MNEFALMQASQRHAHRNLQSVGTLGTVGMASVGLAASCSHSTDRSGNGWEHNSSCEHKGTCSCPADLFPLKNTVGTDSQSEARVITGCSHVPTVPTIFQTWAGGADGAGSCA